MDYKDALKKIDEKAELILNASDRVWDAAETAFVEFESMDALCEALAAEGFEVERGVGNVPTAFTGRFGKGKPVVGVLAEYDALSGLSQENWKSEKCPVVPGGNGHGCGHNLLGAGALGAAIAVKEYLQATGEEGTVIFYGCPGEEGGSGKAFMAGAGVFDECDFCVTWHPGTANFVSANSSLANYQILYKFDGLSSHAAATPHLGRSALDAVTLMNTGVQFLREHIIPEARMHYALIDTGGFSPNVVQSHAEVLYLLRAPKTPYVHEMFERVNDIAEGAAKMTGTAWSYDFIKACSNIVTNDVLQEQMQQSMEEIPLPELTAEEMEFLTAIDKSVTVRQDSLAGKAEFYKGEQKAMLKSHVGEVYHDFILPLCSDEPAMSGSSDVGDVSWVCPTAMFFSATWAAQTPGHSWQAVTQGKGSVAKKMTIYSAKVMADTMLKLMHDPARMQQAKDELKERLEGGKYVCPIPAGVKPRSIDPSKK